MILLAAFFALAHAKCHGVENKHPIITTPPQHVRSVENGVLFKVDIDQVRCYICLDSLNACRLHVENCFAVFQCVCDLNHIVGGTRISAIVDCACLRYSASNGLGTGTAVEERDSREFCDESYAHRRC